MGNGKKVNLESMDIAEEKRELLKKVFPEVFNDGKVDFDQLKRVLGESVEPSSERYALSWPGKADCMKIIQQPSVAALRPARGESLEFDKTGHLFIEGDNLEVLKLMQKSYFGKVKFIYIDPPYNTGKEFIYVDKYGEALDAYLEYTGQKDGEGRKFSTNSDTDGRYHSRWLNTMYPRLYLARNLLCEDGLIFISIDDHEQANLKALCNLILGEENFIAQFVWKKRTGSNDAQNNASIDHDYIVCYGKGGASLNGVRKSFENYSNPDNDPRGDWAKDNLTCNKTSSERPNLFYPITDPKTGITYRCNPNRVWVYEKERMQQMIDEGKVLFPDNGESTPMYKRHRSEVRSNTKPFSSIIETEMNFMATKKLRGLLGGQYFDHPKGVGLINKLIEQGTDADSIVLDFFAGSSTTAHAVYEANNKDGGKRRFICVQIPEPCNEKSEAYKAGYETVADISKQRIRLAAEKIKKECDNRPASGGGDAPDLGFKVFKLSRSNFKVWEGDASKITDLEQQLFDHIDHIDKASTPEDILHEILLKTGFPLTTQVEKARMAGKDVFSIEGGSMLICLDKSLDRTVIEAMADAEPRQVICLDEGFRGNDQLKANAVQTFKTRAREKESEIVFRTI